MIKHILPAAALMLVAGTAMAAQTVLNMTFTTPDSTAIACPLSNPYAVPASSGAVICHYTVSPASWQGSVTLSGADAAAFVIVPSTSNEGDLKVGATAITAAGSKTVTLTSAP